MTRTFRKIVSISCLLSFLATNSAYPMDVSSLRPVSFIDRESGKPGNPGNLLQQRTETPGLEHISFPLLMPATVDELLQRYADRIKAELGDDYTEEAARAYIERMQGRINIARRGVGQEVAAGSIEITKSGKNFGGNVSAAAAGGGQLSANVSETNQLLELVFNELLEKQSDKNVKAAFNAVLQKKKEGSVALSFRRDHDRLMNLSPKGIRPSPRGIFIDTTALSGIRDASARDRRGIVVLCVLGLLQQFYLIGQARPEAALNGMLDFYKNLPDDDKDAVVGLLESHKIDNAGNFLNFLNKGVTDPEKYTELILRQEVLDLAYDNTEFERALLTREGLPNVEGQPGATLSLKDFKAGAYRLHGTYNLDVETENAERVARETQEQGIEIVLGYLGRAGLVEQFLMAAAEKLPPKALREPVRKIYEAYMAQNFDAVKTPELREGLKEAWDKIGAGYLQDIINLTNSDSNVPSPQLKARIDDFLLATTSFLTSFIEKEMELRLQKGSVIYQETVKSKKRASKTSAQMGQDVKCVTDAVMAFQVNAFEELRLGAEALPKLGKVFNVAFQRADPTESAYLFMLNLLMDPYFSGRDSDISKLLLAGGRSLHATSAMAPWLRHASHWIQALPAWAHYEIKPLEGNDYVVVAGAQRGILESAMKSNIQARVENVEEVMHLDHAALARRFLADRMGPAFKKELNELVAQRKGMGDQEDQSREEAMRLLLKEKGMDDAVAALAALIDATYANLRGEVVKHIDQQAKKSRYVERVAALWKVIRDNESPQNLVRGFLDVSVPDPDGSRTLKEANELIERNNLGAVLNIMKPLAMSVRRPMPTFHNLTTLGPGETTTYLNTWIEAGMAQYLFCRDRKDKAGKSLLGVTDERMAEYQRRMNEAALYVARRLKLLGEEGIWAELRNKGVDSEDREEMLKLMPDIMNKYRDDVAKEVNRICAILEYEEAQGRRSKTDSFEQEPAPVTEYIKNNRVQLEEDAIEYIISESKYEGLSDAVKALMESERLSWKQAARRVITGEPDPDLREEYRLVMEIQISSLARAAVIKEIDRKDKKAKLDDKARGYKFLHSDNLAWYNVSREVIQAYLEESGENPDVFNDVKYRYESAGPYKMFHVAYTPSRVDLGGNERESTEGIGKVVTAMDQAGLNAAAALYNSYNLPGAIEYPRTEIGEFFKARENFFTRGGVFYLSLGEGINIDSLMMGDAENFMRHSNLRGDRIVLPTGESYRGFCVPKEFFLIYAVMSAADKDDKNRTAAKNILKNFFDPEIVESFFNKDGEIDRSKPNILADMCDALDLRKADQSFLEWEKAAREFFAGKYENYFKVLGNTAFLGNLPKLAQVLERWKIALPSESAQTRMQLARLTNWANKKLQGLEQINRIGPDRKISLGERLRRKVEKRVATENEKRRNERKPEIRLKNATEDVYTTGGAYKPGTRKYPITDARFSAALIKLLRFSGITNVDMTDFDPEVRSILGTMAEAYVRPGDFRVVGLVSSANIMGAIPDKSGQVGAIAKAARDVLVKAGLNDDQIKTQFTNEGAKFWKWTINEDIKKQLSQNKVFLQGVLLLALQEREVYNSYEEALQGADFVDLANSDEELLDLIDNLPKLLYLMGQNNEDGVRIFMDGVVGARRRAFTTRYVDPSFKVKELFALDEFAEYGALGLGEEDVALWRAEMERERAQAQMLLDALLDNNVDTARTIYDDMVFDVKFFKKHEKAAAFEKEAAEPGRNVKNPYLRYASRALGNVNAGLSLEKLDFATWLILGGRYILNGKYTEEEFAKARKAFERAVKALPETEQEVTGKNLFEFTKPEITKAQKLLLQPKYEPSLISEFTEKRTLIVTASKAEESGGTETLALMAERDRKEKEGLMLIERQKVLDALVAASGAPMTIARDTDSISDVYGKAMQVIGSPDSAIGQDKFAQLLYLTHTAFIKAVNKIIPDNAEPERLQEKAQMIARITGHLSGGPIDPSIHKAATADLIRLIALESERLDKAENKDRTNIEEIAKVGELLNMALIVSMEYDIALAGERGRREKAVDALFDFFDKVANPHTFDYFPFLIQPALSDGVFDKWYSHDEKIKFAADRHKWLYSRIRRIIVSDTPLSDKSSEYQKRWVGDVSSDNPADWVMGIGVNVDTQDKQFWYSYANLREVVTMMHELSYGAIHNPGSMEGVPEIFWDVDPDVIEAGAGGKFTNVVSVYPHGNTTMPVAIEQGPYFEQKKCNLMLCPFPAMTYDAAYGKEVLQVRDAIMYVSAKRYEKLLKEARGVNPAQAGERARRVPKEGIMVAMKFREPVSKDVDGRKCYSGAVTADAAFLHFTHELRPYLDRLDMPKVQPLAYEALTYLKGDVPLVLKNTAAGFPAGFVWRLSDTKTAADEAANTAVTDLTQTLGRKPAEVEVGRYVEQYVKNRIRARLWEFIKKYRVVVTEIIEKPEKESGGRGAEAMPILNRATNRQGKLRFVESDKDADDRDVLNAKLSNDAPEGLRNLHKMTQAIYDISKTDNVIIQDLIHSHARLLFTQKSLRAYQAAQADKGRAVSLDAAPLTAIFNYFRAISTKGMGDFRRSQRMDIRGGEAIGNVARGSIMGVFEPDAIQPEFREPLMRAMETAFSESLEARRAYLMESWPHALREYLALNQRFGKEFQKVLEGILRDNYPDIMKRYFSEQTMSDADATAFEGFFSSWIGRFLGVDEDGKDFSTALAPFFEERHRGQGDKMAAEFKRCLGTYLNKNKLLDLDIHYSMDDAMPFYLGDENKNYLYVMKKKADDTFDLDDEGNVQFLSIRDPSITLFDKEGNPISNKRDVPIFERDGSGNLVEREIYLYPGKKARLNCIEGCIIEFNPGAGLWRPHNNALRKLDPARNGEGVKMIFDDLAERGAVGLQARRQAALAKAPQLGVLPPAAQTLYFGEGETLRLPRPDAKEGTMEFFIDGAAKKARAELNKGAKYKFTPDDMSLIVTYAAVDMLISQHNGNVDEIRAMPVIIILAVANGIFSNPQFKEALRARLDLADGLDLDALAANLITERSMYRAAVQSGIIEYLEQQKDPIAIRMSANRLSRKETGDILGARPTCGLIFSGREAPFSNTVHAFHKDAAKYFRDRPGMGLNFIGVHKDWVDLDGKASMALVVDTNGLVKKVVFEEPVSLQAVSVLHLDARGERAAHQEISEKFEQLEIPVINPYDAEERLDSKSATHEACKGLEQPFFALIDRDEAPGEAALKAKLKAYIWELLGPRARGTMGAATKQVRVVIQPDKGTEGQLAEALTLSVKINGPTLDNTELVDDNALKKALKHIAAIYGVNDNAIIREFRGNVLYKGRNVVFRLNVAPAADGALIAESGYARVAGKPGQAIVSKQQDATTESINTVIRGLEWKGRPLASLVDTNYLISELKKAATAAVNKLGSKSVVGVDLLVELNQDRNGNIMLDVVFLEANPRPALLGTAVRIEGVKLGVRPDIVPEIVNPGFYQFVFDKIMAYGGVSVMTSSLPRADESCILRAMAADERIKEKQREELLSLLGRSDNPQLYKQNRPRIMELSCDVLGIRSPEEFRPIRPVRGIILAAGKGTRLQEADYKGPKALYPINGRPMIFYVLDHIRRFDKKPIIVVSEDNKGEIERAVSGAGYDAEYVIQDMSPNAITGTGAGVLAAREALKGFPGDLIINWSDNIVRRPETMRDALLLHQAAGANFTLPTTYLREPKTNTIQRDAGTGQPIGSNQALDGELAPGEVDIGLFLGGARDIFDSLGAMARNERYLTRGASGKMELGFPKIMEYMREGNLTACAVNCADPIEAGGINNIRQAAIIAQRLNELNSPGAMVSSWRIPASAALQAFSNNNWKTVPTLRARLEMCYGTDEQNLEVQAQRYLKTIQTAIDRGFASMDGEIIIVRAPGRLKIGNANDYAGAMFDSAVMATREDTIFIMSPRDDNKINLGTIEPGQFPNCGKYSVNDHGLNPTNPITKMDSWDAWFASLPSGEQPMLPGTTDRDKFWFAMPWAATAWARGAVPDKRADRGYNLFVGDSTTPAAGGLSSSSNILIGTLLGLNGLYDLGLSDEEIIEAGYSERGACGTKGGIADHAAIVLCEFGQLGRLGLEPTKMKTQFNLPEGLHMFVIDTGINREAVAPLVSDKIAKEAGVTEPAVCAETANGIKARGGLGGRLGLIYFKYFFMSRGDKFSYLRDIVGDGKATAEAAANGITEDEIREVLVSLPKRISQEELLRKLRYFEGAGLDMNPGELAATIKAVEGLKFPEDGLPLRGLVTYFVSGAAKMHEFFKAAQQGDIDKVTEVVKACHNGDRVSVLDTDTNTMVAYDGTPTDDELINKKTALWRLAGVRERSLEGIDWLIDTVESDTKGKTALMVLAAGLGGQVIAFVPQEEMAEFNASVRNRLRQMTSEMLFRKLVDLHLEAEAEKLAENLIAIPLRQQGEEARANELMARLRSLIGDVTYTTEALDKAVELFRENFEPGVKEYKPGQGASVMSISSGEVAAVRGNFEAAAKAIAIAI